MALGPAALGTAALGTALLGALLLVASSAGAQSGEAVVDQVDFSQRAHHEAQVDVTFPAVETEVLEVRMSRTSPGRYALHEFAKNVYSVSAATQDGEPLTVVRANPHQWNVQVGEGGTVVFSYTLYADRVDGTYSAVDRSHAHLNGPATWAWGRGLEDRPVEVHLSLPDGWQVATQLVGTDDPGVFRAPDLPYLMDSPVEASEHWKHSWTIPASAEEPGQEQTVRIALHHVGSEEIARIYAELTEAIVAEQIAIFGVPPVFDHGEYVFLADYLPWASGDGMEHRNSTILTSSTDLEEGLIRRLGTVAHEFFHAWNIERIRPASLEPFDFERANMSEALWFGEGFTSYFDDLTLARAGIIGFEDYVDGLSSSLGGFLQAPGRRYRSPVEMSHQAPFVDAASWIDPTNRANTFISYYTYGAMLGLGLDLELRTGFDTTLDEYMRRVWEAHGATEIPYTMADLEAILAELATDQFASDFFSRSVFDSELPEYGRLLEAAGLALQRVGEDGWIGDVALRDDVEGIVVEGAPQVGTPLHRAGLGEGDTILRVDGGEPSLAEIEELVRAADPGTSLALEVESRGTVFETALVVAEDPSREVVTFEALGRPVGAEIEAFRGDWLGAKSDHEHPSARKRCPEGGRTFDFETVFCPWHGDRLVPTFETSAPPGSSPGG